MGSALMIPGSGTTGPFGKVYFFFSWQNYYVDGFFPSKFFSGVRYETYGVFFTPIKTLNVVFHVTSAETPSWYGKIRKSAEYIETIIKDGTTYTLEGGTEYRIAYGRDNDRDYPGFIFYTNNKEDDV